MRNQQDTLEPCCGTRRERRNELRAAGWTLVWAICWVSTSALLKTDRLDAGMLGAAIILLPTVVGVAMLMSFRKLIAESDELRRKIQLDALAITVGVTLVGSVTYLLLEQANLIADADISGVILIISITYPAAVLIGGKRYA